MSNFDEWVQTLDPKTAKRYQTAREVELQRLPVASYGLTRALGGGIGKGRISMLYGPASTGKSLHWGQSVGKWQKMGYVGAWVDVEDTYEKEFAAKLGINNDELILIQKKDSASIEREIKPLLRAGIDFIVIDSISDMIPAVFVEDGEIKAVEDRKQMGQHAKACTELMRTILYENRDTAVCLVSQVTTEFGQTYVKMVPHGGKKTYHACSQIIKLTSTNTENSQIKGDVVRGSRVVQEPIGRKVTAYVEKNKLGSQSKSVEYDLYYAGNDLGVDFYGEIIDTAIYYGVIEKSGAWLNWGDQKWQGRPKVISDMRNNPELFGALEAELDLALNGGDLSAV